MCGAENSSSNINITITKHQRQVNSSQNEELLLFGCATTDYRLFRFLMLNCWLSQTTLRLHNNLDMDIYKYTHLLHTAKQFTAFAETILHRAQKGGRESVRAAIYISVVVEYRETFDVVAIVAVIKTKHHHYFHSLYLI